MKHPMNPRRSEGGAIALSIALALLTAFLLSGCSKSVDRSVYPDKQVPAGVYEFKLSDGTRCAAILDRALTCDWPTSRRGVE